MFQVTALSADSPPVAGCTGLIDARVDCPGAWSADSWRPDIAGCAGLVDARVDCPGAWSADSRRPDVAGCTGLVDARVDCPGAWSADSCRPARCARLIDAAIPGGCHARQHHCYRCADDRAEQYMPPKKLTIVFHCFVLLLVRLMHCHAYITVSFR
jgi:hypothetical protein